MSAGPWSRPAPATDPRRVVRRHPLRWRHGLRTSRSDRSGGQPPLPRHDELRPADQRGRQLRDHGSRAGARHQLLRHRQRLRLEDAARGSPSRSSAAGWRRAAGAASRSSWPPRSTARWASGPTSRGSRPTTSVAPATRACAACRPTTSTSTRCTTSIATRRGRRSGRRWSSWCTQGKVLYVGSSNFAGWHIAQAQGDGRAARNFLGLVSEQSLYNLNARTIELEVIPACRALRPRASSRGARSAAGCSAACWRSCAGGRRANDQIQKRIGTHRAQLEAYEGFCRELGERAGRCGAGLAAAQPGRDRADHRARARSSSSTAPARARDRARARAA